MASKPLSVAHISLARGYKGNERQTELLIKELAKLGVPQTLVCRDDSPLPIHVEGVNKLRIVKIAGLSDPSFIGHFKIGSSPTILHAHEAHAIKWCFLHYLFFGIPYIITARKPNPEKKGFFDSAYYNGAAAVVGISKIIKNNFEQAFKRKVEFIGDCSSNFRANPEIVQRYRQALKNRFVVGQVGALVNRENSQTTLIDAAKLLKQQLPELVLVFVGAGDDMGLLRMHAEGMPNVKFIGFKRNYIDYIASFDVFAYPVNQEGVGSIILDTMEQGVPVIASAVDGIPDLIKNGVNGFLIKPGDAKSLAHYILQLKRDRGTRNSLVQNAYAEVENHGSSAMAASYYRLYTAIINGEYNKKYA